MRRHETTTQDEPNAAQRRIRQPARVQVPQGRGRSPRPRDTPCGRVGRVNSRWAGGETARGPARRRARRYEWDEMRLQRRPTRDWPNAAQRRIQQPTRVRVAQGAGRSPAPAARLAAVTVG